MRLLQPSFGFLDCSSPQKNPRPPGSRTGARMFCIPETTGLPILKTPDRSPPRAARRPQDYPPPGASVKGGIKNGGPMPRRLRGPAQRRGVQFFQNSPGDDTPDPSPRSTKEKIPRYKFLSILHPGNRPQKIPSGQRKFDTARISLMGFQNQRDTPLLCRKGDQC